nr:MAG TPA: hypothetical protein [Caudoviricetes sp.]
MYCRMQLTMPLQISKIFRMLSPQMICYHR